MKTSSQKMDESASGSYTEDVFLALNSTQSLNHFAANFSRGKRLPPLENWTPLWKRTRPEATVKPAVTKSSLPPTKTPFFKGKGKKVDYSLPRKPKTSANTQAIGRAQTLLNFPL